MVQPLPVGVGVVDEVAPTGVKEDGMGDMDDMEDMEMWGYDEAWGRKGSEEEEGMEKEERGERGAEYCPKASGRSMSGELLSMKSSSPSKGRLRWMAYLFWSL